MREPEKKGPLGTPYILARGWTCSPAKECKCRKSWSLQRIPEAKLVNSSAINYIAPPFGPGSSANSRYKWNDFVDSAEGRALELGLVSLEGTKSAPVPWNCVLVLNPPAAHRQLLQMALDLWIFCCIKKGHQSLESWTWPSHDMAGRPHII